MPTSRPNPVPDAENAGDNSVDLTSSAAATPSPREVVSEAPPKPAEQPAPKPAPEAPEPVAEPTPAPDPVPEPAAEKPAEPTPAPVDVAALPAETTPDPVAEAITEAAPAEPQFAALPSAGPVPQTRPEPARRLHRSPRRKPPRRRRAISMPIRWQRCSTSRMPRVAARSGRPKPLRLAAPGQPGATRSARARWMRCADEIQKYWNIIPGMADGGDVRVTVKMRLDPAGNIIGEPDVSASGGSAGTRGTLSGSARRAVLRAQPYQLPQEKYDSCAESTDRQLRSQRRSSKRSQAAYVYACSISSGAALARLQHCCC